MLERGCMIIRVKRIETMSNYKLKVSFDDDVIVLYDMNEDINTLPNYTDLRDIYGLWEQVQLDESRTCIFWNDYIDIASDTIYEFGERIS